jgi:hypothetical protein
MRIPAQLTVERMNMPPSRAIASLAAVALLGVAAVAATATGSHSAPQSAAVYSAPIAQASGSDVVALPLPSIVNVRLVRAQAALDRGVAAVDQGHNALAIPEFASVQANMTDAWTAAKYVIETTPPPPVAEAGAVARISGAAPVTAGAVAAPEDTAFAVLTLQHTVLTTAVGLIDTLDADSSTLAYLRKMARAALNQRNAAITYIHAIPVPPAPAGARPQATTSGAAPVAGNAFATVMPNLIPQFDDEMQEMAGTIAINPGLSAKTQRTLTSWSNSVAATELRVNTFWPPVPAAG